MGRCNRVRDLLGAYLTAEATPGERRLVKEHLSRCPICAGESRARRGLLARIPTDVQAEAPAEIKDRVLAQVMAQRPRRAPAGRPRLVWACAVAAGAGMLMAAWWLSQPLAPTERETARNAPPALLNRSPGQVTEVPVPVAKQDESPVEVARPDPAPAPRRYAQNPHRTTVTRHTVRDPKPPPPQSEQVPPESKAPPAETILQPQAPAPGASVPTSAPLRLQWTPCPDAAEYEVTVTEAESGEEVARARVAIPEQELTGLSLTPSHTYQVRVIALSKDGALLGSTDAPWSFTAAPQQ